MHCVSPTHNWSSTAYAERACLVCCRDAEPSDGHPVLSVSWSPSGDAFLVVTGSAQVGVGVG